MPAPRGITYAYRTCAAFYLMCLSHLCRVVFFFCRPRSARLQQTDISELLWLVEDPYRWEEAAKNCQTCVVCGQSDKPLALEELHCVVCECRIAKGGGWAFPSNEPNQTVLAANQCRMKKKEMRFCNSSAKTLFFFRCDQLTALLDLLCCPRRTPL